MSNQTELERLKAEMYVARKAAQVAAAATWEAYAARDAGAAWEAAWEVERKAADAAWVALEAARKADAAKDAWGE